MSETASRILNLFSKKRTRLGNEAEQALARCVQDLPLSESQWENLKWFYGLPHDEADIDLRSRYRDADSVARNLFTAVERAEGYATRSGGTKNGGEKNGAPAAEPEGCWEWFGETYVGVPRPASWFALPASIRSEFTLKGRNG